MVEIVMSYLYDIKDTKLFLINYLPYADLIHLSPLRKRFSVRLLRILLPMLKPVALANNYFQQIFIKRIKSNVLKTTSELFKSYTFSSSISALVMVVS